MGLWPGPPYEEDVGDEKEVGEGGGNENETKQKLDFETDMMYGIELSNKRAATIEKFDYLLVENLNYL